MAYHWRISHKDPKTGALKSLVNNANVTDIKAFDADQSGARVVIKGHKVLANTGEHRDYEVMLTRDVIQRAAKELGLLS